MIPVHDLEPSQATQQAPSPASSALESGMAQPTVSPSDPGMPAQNVAIGLAQALNFINTSTVTTLDGSAILMTTNHPRKVRSDKGKIKGPQKRPADTPGDAHEEPVQKKKKTTKTSARNATKENQPLQKKKQRAAL